MNFHEFPEPFSQAERVSPRIDFVFKHLFGTEENKPLLISLLNAVLQRPEGEAVETVEFHNPFEDGEYFEEKQSILDIKAQDQKGRWFNVEIQCDFHRAFPERLLFYWSRLYSTQLKKGERYETLNGLIAMFLVLRHSELDSESLVLKYLENGRLRVKPGVTTNICVFPDRTTEACDCGGFCGLCLLSRASGLSFLLSCTRAKTPDFVESSIGDSPDRATKIDANC